MNLDVSTEPETIIAEESLQELGDRADRTLGPLLLIASIIAWAGSATLVWERLQIYMDANHQSVCDLNALLNCGTVMRTDQAAVFGFPNPFIGIVGFAIVTTIGAGLLAGGRFRPWFWWSTQLGVTFAMGFILWLWYNTTFIINALCLFCMLVWLMTVPIFIFVTARNLTNGLIPAPERVRRIAGAWSWFTTALIYLLLFGIIVIRFFEQIVNLF
ncbi:vitamin K epoxide reductase family protein [Rothia sp. ZJ932]|uniref:vitamin K epoxide reductase family protein n=1 Tax=Rothia sp. ZJ932 TaxID=2810516 RepID=UPI0019688878|nr:vitamin K epoxide reductase family protein [Rothia sp. ZJ932]QRZ62415.1 vitamin K epoxide reductase family protein [Rothia sp. ZJ932]